MKQFTYDEVVAKADSIKAVMGERPTVFLRDEVNPPYAKAFEFEAGSTMRLGMSTSGYFSAVVKGVVCKWSFDLEGWEANGTSALAPRVNAIRDVMQKLEGRARQQFREWLVDVANKVRADAAETRARCDQETAKAATLADIAGEP